jgi:PAS domain S-box-containing protein
MESLKWLFSRSHFMPHGYCYLWNPGLVWLHVVSDTLIALAYLSIPITLIYFVRKKRGLPFHWMFVCFGVFIIACGATHVMEVWNLWHANYWLAGYLKALTALASMVTAALLVPLIPKALALPTRNDLEEANKLLVAQSGRLALATAVAKVGVWDLDLVSNTATWDATMFEIYGFAPTLRVRHEEWARVVHHQDLPVIEARLRKVIADKGQDSTRFRICRPDGAIRNVAAAHRAVVDEHGNVTRLIGVNMDVTEKSRAEDALRQSEEQFRQLAENIREVFFIQTPDPIRTLYISPAYDEIWGRPRQELYDRPSAWIESVHAEDRERASDVFQKCMEGVATDLEFRVKRPDDSVRWIHARSFPVFDANGKFIRAVGIAEDITERRRVLDDVLSARAAAEATDRIKSQFLANMSHELRTPLNGILGMTKLALETDVISEQRDYMSIVDASAESLLTVINDILDFSKIEAGKLDFEAIEFNIRENLEADLKALNIRAREKHIELNWRVGPEVPRLLTGDPGRLRQIIVNLVGNAIKFTDRGGVTVDVQKEPAEASGVALHFSVTDSGIGIAKDKQSTIFDAFAQADGSTARRYGGSGLGLTISRRLVEMFGGRLWLDSALDAGSTFHFTARFGVPSAEMKRLPPPVIHDSMEEPARKLRILLAEDNRVNQMIVVRLMQKRGHTVEVASNGREALERFKLSDFDLLLMDVQMPELDGLETTAAIREIEKSEAGHIPIIAMTAHAMKGDRERCLAAGMDGYISKPFQINELLKEIESLPQLISSTI